MKHLQGFRKISRFLHYMLLKYEEKGRGLVAICSDFITWIKQKDSKYRKRIKHIKAQTN